MLKNTNLAAYWANKLDGCVLVYDNKGEILVVNSDTLEDLAVKIHVEVYDKEYPFNGNYAPILDRFKFYSIEDDNVVKFTFSTMDYNDYNFGLADITDEIVENNPVLLVYTPETYDGNEVVNNEDYEKGASHIVVCAGFEVINDVVYTYVCDGWCKFYRRMHFGTEAAENGIVYNEDLVTLDIVEVTG